jgi:hypothetical protein
LASLVRPSTDFLRRALNFVDEESHEQRDVASALAQRGQRDRDDVEAVEQILAERPRRDLALQVPVGRRHEAHVDADRLDAADALELALLQHAQSFTCISLGISPISSRKSVPPEASSKRPGLEATAPVKAPFS